MFIDIQCFLVFFHAYAYISISNDQPFTKTISIQFSPSIPELSDMNYTATRSTRDHIWSLKYASKYITINRENSGAISDVRGTLTWSSQNSECMYSPSAVVSKTHLYGNSTCYKNDDVGVTIPIGIVADTTFSKSLINALLSDISFIYKSKFNIELIIGSFYQKSSDDVCKESVRSTLEYFDMNIVNSVTKGNVAEMKRNAAWILLTSECKFKETGSAYFGSMSRTANARKSAVVNVQKEVLFHSLYKQIANLLSNNECDLLRHVIELKS